MTLQRMIHELRKLLDLIESSDFLQVYQASPVSTRAEVDQAIMDSDYSKVLRWFDLHKKDVIGSLTMRELRNLARSYKIPYYTTMPRAIILSHIKKRLD